jgi:Putative transmembrane protein (PGPGW)
VLLWWLFAASVAMFLATPAVAGWLVVRLPTDYFTAKRRTPTAWWRRHRGLRPLVLVVKNLAGIVLVVAGLVMLVTPGQGLLTIAVGLMLVDFPGKFRVERWLATRPPVWRSINWLRCRAGRQPLERPD